MPRQPNIIVFMGDQWRRQSLGFMNRDPVVTPNFDRFAAEATAVERAYCCYPLCTPARASFFTGQYPQTLGMMYNWRRLPADQPNLATVLDKQGYDTALIGKWHMDDWEETDRYGDIWNTLTPPGPRRRGIRYWYSNGCNHDHFTSKYLDTDGNYIEKREWTPTHETTRAIQYIRNANGERPAHKPFFLWLSTGTPHNGRSPDGTNRTGDSWQTNPIYPGEGYDHVMREHHEQLSEWFDSVNDDFLTRYWKPTRP